MRDEVTKEERDLLTVPDNYELAHCVAPELRLSRGIAACFAEKFGRLDGLEEHELEFGRAIEVPGIQRPEPVSHIVTKEISEHKSTYERVWNALRALREALLEKDVMRLAIPRIGCGPDSLNW